LNEAETRAELIDKQLQASGWGVIEAQKFGANIPSPKAEFKQVASAANLL